MQQKNFYTRIIPKSFGPDLKLSNRGFNRDHSYTRRSHPTISIIKIITNGDICTRGCGVLLAGADEQQQDHSGEKLFHV